mmetsp:Transcript_134239/g.287084  ORF Transcript_134239/g.287084 Transcript_134239/m.287084 type:complete len:278 (+) Transcript_134239:2078-2911(+)
MGLPKLTATHSLPSIVHACRPERPVTEDAVLGALASSFPAPLSLDQRAAAGLAPTSALLDHRAVTLAELGTGGLRPLSPSTKATVLWRADRLATDVRAIDNTNLRCGAGNDFRAFEEKPFRGCWFLAREPQVPFPHLRVAPALLCATIAFHVGPSGPSAIPVLDLLTRAQAGTDLFGRPSRASLATEVGLCLDGAVAIPLSSALGAIPPVRPFPPLAIHAAQGTAPLLVASSDLDQRFVARRTVIAVGRNNVAIAHLIPSSTTRCAGVPIFPRAHQA